jgi:glycosyltransferase involved in cell wall biosynthesis
VISVLSIAFPFAPVGPNLVGGAEQILTDLDAALVAAGDRSLVVACEGSKPAGSLFAMPLPHCPDLDEVNRGRYKDSFHAAVDHALASGRVDLVHAHCMDLFDYEFPAEIPLLITLHLPIGWYRKEMFERYRDRAYLCCVSESQRREAVGVVGDAEVIENGADVPTAQDESRAEFALVMGRICPEKNAHTALEAGTKAKTPVMIGGQVYPYRTHQQYFEEKIQPLIASSRPPADHRFLGPVKPKRRQRLLSQAKCLLHPTLAPETSSLVAMEALAAGTPVVAYRSGALPEIVEDGVTGFIVDDADQMAKAIGLAHTISPAACRNAAQRRFSKQRMIRQYFDTYQRILNEGHRPRASSC